FGRMMRSSYTSSGPAPPHIGDVSDDATPLLRLPSAWPSNGSLLIFTAAPHATGFSVYSSVSDAAKHPPESDGKSFMPFSSLSLPSAHCGQNGPSGQSSVSSSCCGAKQPGSFG